MLGKIYFALKILSYTLLFAISTYATIFISEANARIDQVNSTYSPETLRKCLGRCFMNTSCKSLNHNNKTMECELSQSTIRNGGLFMESGSDWSNYEKRNDADITAPLCIKCNNSEWIQGLHFTGDVLEKHVYHIESSVSSMSICFWFKVESIVKAYQHFISILNTLSCDAFEIYLEGGMFFVYFDKINYLFKGIEQIELGKLYHFCLLTDGEILKIFLNSKTDETMQQKTASNNIQSIPVLSIILGQNINMDQKDGSCRATDKKYALNGFIGNIDIWSRELDFQEIEALYKNNSSLLIGDVASRFYFLKFTPHEGVARQNLLMTDINNGSN